MSEVRPTGVENVGWAEWGGARGGEALAGVDGVLARGAAGVTSLVHALLARSRWTGCTGLFM